LLQRLHREFNVSAAEMDLHDNLKQALVACAMVGNEHAHLESAMQGIERWVEGNWPDAMIISQHIDLI
jgi:uncharacterized protein YlxP (DUF503 family)